ncbi:MAG: N,N-dimethylformamidase beta subunit family domain-containing protein [Actinomycetota bacterium]
MASLVAGTHSSDSDQEKVVVGYCEPWSARAGDAVTLMASSDEPCTAEVSLVRISCGDPTTAGPGYAEEDVPVDLPAAVTLDHQPILPGSYGLVDLEGIRAITHLDLSFSIFPTRPQDGGAVVSLIAENWTAAVVIDDGLLFCRVDENDGDEIVELPLRGQRLTNRRWYDVRITFDLRAGRLSGSCEPLPTRSPGRNLLEPQSDPAEVAVEWGPTGLSALILAGTLAGGSYDGKIARPVLTADDAVVRWDLAQDMAGWALVDVSGHHRHGELHQLPARAVTGPTWDGSHQRWSDDPSQWNAVHFHRDDLYDAGWEPTAEVHLPADLPSGIYAFRIETEHGEDRVPFFVRPAANAATADVAFLASTATYIAYANHRMLFEGADFIKTRNRLRPEHDYVRRHPELCPSMYERHRDGSGVMFSSRRRPVLNLRPGADGWNFTPDTDINAYLERTGIDHDVITDEDVHHEGIDALAPYRVLVTCTHPEYWSTAMLDALEQWQADGGRLMYLGGNGFYWRVAFSDSWPGAVELRRAEDGVRNWQTEDGESYHAFTGEYGGMWRRLGRPPNQLVGIGFAAQGFQRATHFEVNEESNGPRTSWIWDGVDADDGRIGTSGLGGGAAGQEIDRFDTRLGSPPHAVTLASATSFGPDMVRTKEEFEGSVVYPVPDPYVRADVVFFETPGGGATFSVGSISWFGALARNDYDNDVAIMTTNVLQRFVDPTPFPPPPWG